MKSIPSRRYFHERTGEPMPTYVIGEFVVEKARRDWDARGYRGSAGNPDRREWWEVRRQGSRLQPGVSPDRQPLFVANTLRECKLWIAASPNERELMRIEDELAHVRDPGIRHSLAAERKALRDRMA